MGELTGLHRRLNGIPNPYHQFILSKAICDNWSDILTKFISSKVSASIPDIDINGKRAIIQFSKYNQFKENCLIDSFDTFYELRTDISKYYPSIYTHSIPWAIHSKAFAKKNRGNSHYGNYIDECIRNTQNGQTNGIVIGTDTSRIIAEIIGCYIDNELSNSLSKEKIKIKGYRFVDDCHFFFYSLSDTEKALKHFQIILSELNLNINEEKTQISQAPFQFESNWQSSLTNFRIRYKENLQRNDIKIFFNLLIELSKKHEKDSVIKYGIKIIKRLKIHINNWELYQSIILSLCLAEGAILPDILQILLQNKPQINISKLKSTISSLLNQHIYKGNNYEVSWSLWIAKTFKIKIENKIAQQIINSNDIISTIILLDMKHSNLINGRIITKNLKLDFNSEGLKSNKWMLIYEATIKKWVSSKCLNEIKFFEEFSKLKISFYDPSKQVEIGDSNIIGIIQNKPNKSNTQKQNISLGGYL